MVPRERHSNCEYRESTGIMIFRAAFFIGLVAMLMPHEPDIGLGRPGAVIGLPSPASVISAVVLPRM